MNRRVLTDSDLEVLKGEQGDISDRAWEQRRTRMRNHVRTAILELADLAELLGPEDREAIFLPAPSAEASPTQMAEAPRKLIRLAYLAERNRAPYPEEAIEAGVELAERQYSVEKGERPIDADVSVEIVTDRGDVDVESLAEEFLSTPESLTQRELVTLLDAKTVSPSSLPDIDVDDLVEAM